MGGVNAGLTLQPLKYRLREQHLILVGREVECFLDQGGGGGGFGVHALFATIFNKCYKMAVFIKTN